jgi:hypothetical protein
VQLGAVNAGIRQSLKMLKETGHGLKVCPKFLPFASFKLDAFALLGPPTIPPLLPEISYLNQPDPPLAYLYFMAA